MNMGLLFLRGSHAYFETTLTILLESQKAACQVLTLLRN
jgi:hypothetical protein